MVGQYLYTMYYIKAASAVNCFRIDSFTVKVEEPIRTEVKSPVRICQGKFINLFAGGGYYYRWGPNYNIYDTLVYNPQVFPDKTFNYKVVIGNNCFSDTSSVDVYVDTLPKIFKTKDTQLFRGQSIDLEAKASGILFEWSPKEGISNPFVPKITIEPLENTIYHISVKDGNQCEGKDSVIVSVYGKDVLLVPTGFTPNGDGINDYFHVLKYLNVKKFNHLEVYNRWGQVVFNAKNIESKWDGNIGNDQCPAGSYIWSSEVINHEGQKIKLTGSVELIR
jgi:gliding motility-associated-like protein